MVTNIHSPIIFTYKAIFTKVWWLYYLYELALVNSRVGSGKIPAGGAVLAAEVGSGKSRALVHVLFASGTLPVVLHQSPD